MEFYFQNMFKLIKVSFRSVLILFPFSSQLCFFRFSCMCTLL